MNHAIRIMICTAALAGMVACDEKPRTTSEKVEDKVKDGLDARPGEKMKDAGEDVKDAVKDVVK